MTIEELFEYSEIEFGQLKELMRQLNPNVCMTKDSLDRLVNDPNSHLYVMRDDESEAEGGCCHAKDPSRLKSSLPQESTSAKARIIGTACLCVFHQPFETNATIESVTVHCECRGRGYGRQLMEYILTEARRLGIDKLHLTSSPKRVVANGLYQSLGFERYETNCYVRVVDGEGQMHP